MKQVLFALIAITTVGLAACNNTGEERVLSVIDGDTVKVNLPYCDECLAQLGGIQAPESNKPGGSIAHKTLTGLINGHMNAIEIIQHGYNQYGQPVVELVLDKTNLNKAMIKHGAARITSFYKDNESLQTFQAKAKQAGLGIWHMIKSGDFSTSRMKQAGQKVMESANALYKTLQDMGQSIVDYAKTLN